MAIDAGSPPSHMVWWESWRADPVARRIADRHYNRQSIGADQFVPPGRCLVLKATGPALWVTSWPFAEYVQHEWAGAWINSCFRREGGEMLASEMILQAIAATRWKWPDVPDLGMVTFVDASKVKHKRDPGRCYRKAGFKHVRVHEGRALGVPAARSRHARSRGSDGCRTRLVQGRGLSGEHDE